MSVRRAPAANLAPSVAAAGVLELLATENESLLLGRDSLLLGDLGLDVLDGFSFFHFDRHGFPRQCLDKELHAASWNGQGRVGSTKGGGSGRQAPSGFGASEAKEGQRAANQLESHGLLLNVLEKVWIVGLMA